jgi:Zn-dependent M28 family amino/carboxypeptidase
MSLKAYAGLIAAGLGMACATAFAAEPAPAFSPSADAIRAHMSFLSSDLLEGREAGTRGYDIAAAYVAARFGELGLKPAGQGGSYLQPVPLLAYRPAAQGTITLRGKDGRKTVLAFGDDFLPSTNATLENVELTAPLVFAGYGVVAPEHGRDDYKGLDVKGKIVVVLPDAPKAYPSEERAFYGSRRLKLAAAAARGALGLITLQTPTQEKIHPFARALPRWQAWSMTWRDASNAPFAPGSAAAPLAALSLGGSAKVFSGAPKPFDAVMAAAELPSGAVPRFDLAQTATVSMRMETRRLESSNVAGLIEGADPALKGEVVVLSAHLDHLGLSAPVKGDGVYNGALDNAAGISTLLEVARGFAQAPQPPRRSILILAVTAEEKGLIGAEYFAVQPTLPKASLVANVNLDMPVLTYAFNDVVAFGAGHSSIGPATKRAGSSMGVGLADDPFPDEGVFVRSDHFRFVEQGIPSVMLATGPGNGGAAAWAKFLSQNYHQPSDDLTQPIDYTSGARFAALNYAVARELADADARPAWNKGDIFARRFAPSH